MKTILFCVAAVAMLTVGCASSGSSPNVATPSAAAAAAAATQPHAQCLVCKYNADLACVDVTVDSTTPRYVYNGQTYYFCSDDCMKTFGRNPAKYLSHGK